MTAHTEDVKFGDYVFYQSPIALKIIVNGVEYNQETIEKRK